MKAEGGRRKADIRLSLPHRCTSLRAMSLLRVLFLLLLPIVGATGATPPTITAHSAAPGVDGTPTDGAVTFTAKITANGARTSVVFEYGESVERGEETTPLFVEAGAVEETIATSITGLTGGREYHFRVVATNDAGTTVTRDETFQVRSTPTAGIQRATGVIVDKATLNGTLKANGTLGTALFQYATNDAFTGASERVVREIEYTEKEVGLAARIEGLERDKTYFFRLVFRPTTGTEVRSAAENFLTNQKPVARPDTFALRSLGTVRLDVRQNDTDADGDKLRVSSVSTPAKGTLSRTPDGLRIIYTPGSAFRGTDSFTYTITDPYPTGTATATVTIRSFGTLLAGNQGGLLVDENGDAVGYFKITTTATGAFSGTVRVNGDRQVIAGTLGTDGTFRGSVEIDGRTVPVALAATQDGTVTTLDVDFDNGRWVAELPTTEASPALRESLAGRYTVEFAGGTAASEAANAGGDPAGTGWAVLKLQDDGVARVKGRLPDGRSFSTRGVLGATSAGGVVTFFDDPRRTRVAGSLVLGSSVTGTLRVDRDSGGSGPFADGYGTQSTATGARYVQPPNGKRAIEGQADADGKRLTISVTGGNAAETFTRNLRVDDDDDVEVLDRDSEGLKVKIDRDSGRFTVRFTGATDDQRIKGTGVFIQGTSGIGRGAGVFTGEESTGKIAITAGSSTAPTTPTTPVTEVER
jgi:hypothetical protein